MRSSRLKHAAVKHNRIGPALMEEGLVVMNMSLEPIGADEGATAILSDPHHNSGRELEPAVNIPDEIREVLGSRKTADLSASKMRFRIGKKAYNCRAFLIQPHDGADTEPMLGLYMQRDSSVTDAIDVVAGQYHLTDREQEALKGIAIGLTSKEMAYRMNISPNTVKSFLRIIMLKMGAATRTGIVSKLLEHSNNNHNGSSST